MTGPTSPSGDPGWAHDEAGGQGRHTGPADQHGPVDPRVQDGIDHLQRAAREVIAASRSLLDAAEDLIEDPEAATRLAGLFEAVTTTAADLVGRTGPGPGPRARAGPGKDGPEDHGPPVQRIPVS